MEKKKYISPKFYIVRIEGESLMDVFDLGSQDTGDAEAKQQIFTDDDWEDDWEE